MITQLQRHLEIQLARFRRVGLTRLPTPLEPLRRLSEYLNGPMIWVKREDCTGFGFGGNKLRKLDFVLADAQDADADTLVSGGVVQSNSQRQVATAAARLGMRCHLAVYHGRVAAPSPEYDTSGNALLNRLFGATLHHVPWSGDRNNAIETLAKSLRDEGCRPFVVPYGVSCGLGTVGYTTCALEIADQCAGLGIEPSDIVHCSGSGSTQAGLTIGASACLPRTSVLGIDIDAEPERVQRDVIRLANEAASILSLPFSEASVQVAAGYAGPAYGVPHAATLEAITLAGRLEGMALDPVYSGKGLAGLIALARAKRWTRDDHVVFVHTGGEPGIFAYASVLMAHGSEVSGSEAEGRIRVKSIDNNIPSC